MDGVDQEFIDNLKSRVSEKIEHLDLYQFKGSVSKLVGLTVEVKLPGLKIGDLCYIEAATARKNRQKLSRLKVMLRNCFCSMTVRESGREVLLQRPENLL